MSKRDYYDVLGVSSDADESALKSAYRKLAMKNHPDRNPDDEVAAERFREAAEAYEILKDPKKREEYDHAFVYYAGHGIQIGSENYLLPIKCDDCETKYYNSEEDIIDYGVNVQKIMRYLTGMTNQVNILILDACRDNPYESNWKPTRSLKGDGLAKISAPTGSIIAFSTDAGNTAADGNGKHTIYCERVWCKIRLYMQSTS